MSRQIYPVDHEFFDRHSDDANYILVFLKADGHVWPEKYRVCITLKRSDKYHLANIAKAMGADRPIMGRKLKRDDLPANAYLAIHSKGLIKSLVSLGFSNKKALSSSAPAHLTMNRDYWRGVVDGDGSLCVGADEAISKRVVTWTPAWWSVEPPADDDASDAIYEAFAEYGVEAPKPSVLADCRRVASEAWILRLVNRLPWDGTLARYAARPERLLRVARACGGSERNRLTQP